MKKTSHKSQRVNGEVQRELSRIIRMEVKDPRVNPMTSVTDVEVTQDLKFCKAYISVLGSEEEVEETIKALQQASGYIRRELARSINLRNTPEITFVADRSIEYGNYMSKRIDDVLKQDAEKTQSE
ncbi:MAG: 30S ribosome-binding factor RbfA [Wujia sp.]